ncbi:MAG: sterol desaturase family protein [Chitinophagales bacterium]
MVIFINIFAFVGAFIFMEGFAWFMHKYVMHGVGWFLHKSHHEPRHGRFELNDLYAFIFAIPAIVLMWMGSPEYNWVFWIGTGISMYGLCYFLFHDVIVHRRLRHKYKPAGKYMQRIVRAHKIHHKKMSKENGEAFGFLFALPKYDVKKTKE